MAGQARHPRTRRPPANRPAAGPGRDGGPDPHARERSARDDDGPRGGHRIRRGVLGEPAALRELGGQRAADPRPHDPPGGHAAGPPRAGADRARSRDLSLPGALPRRRPPLTRPAARARGQRRRLLGDHRRADRRARRHGAPRRAAARRRQAADAGRVRRPAAGGHRRHRAAGLPARRARAQAARARPRGRGRAARRPVRARRRRHPRDRVPPRRSDRARVPVQRDRVRDRRRLGRASADRRARPTRPCSRSRSSASKRTSSCSTTSPSAPASRRPAPPATWPRRSAGWRPSPTPTT